MMKKQGRDVRGHLKPARDCSLLAPQRTHFSLTRTAGLASAQRRTLILVARRSLLACLTERHLAWKPLSSACWRSPDSSVVSFIQASVPSVSVMSAARPGLHQASHRRGVTPFVLFWNFSGVSS